MTSALRHFRSPVRKAGDVAAGGGMTLHEVRSCPLWHSGSFIFLAGYNGGKHCVTFMPSCLSLVHTIKTFTVVRLNRRPGVIGWTLIFRRRGCRIFLQVSYLYFLGWIYDGCNFRKYRLIYFRKFFYWKCLFSSICQGFVQMGRLMLRQAEIIMIFCLREYPRSMY